MYDERIPAILEEEEILREAGSELRALLRPGDKRAVLNFRKLRRIGNSDGQIVATEGAVLPLPLEHLTPVEKRLSRLREVMYKPGVGTWFSVRLEVTSDGELDVDFNFDEEPDWDMPIVKPGQYLTDFQEFPRDAEHTPEWLAGKLDQARADNEKRDRRRVQRRAKKSD